MRLDPEPLAADQPTLTVVRRVLLMLLVIGMLGTMVELVLLEHYESAWQLVPLILQGLAVVVIVWHVAAWNPPSVRALQVTMGAFLLAGSIGVALHYEGSLE